MLINIHCPFLWRLSVCRSVTLISSSMLGLANYCLDGITMRPLFQCLICVVEHYLAVVQPFWTEKNQNKYVYHIYNYYMYVICYVFHFHSYFLFICAFGGTWNFKQRDLFLSLFQWIRKYRAPLLHLRHKSAQVVRWKKRESMQW